jgi:hypothetical protein
MNANGEFNLDFVLGNSVITMCSGDEVLFAAPLSPTFALHGISPIFGGRIPFTVNVGFVEKPWVKT